jgi:hypothetical protein
MKRFVAFGLLISSGAVVGCSGEADPIEEVTAQPEEPNKGVPFHGVDGAYTTDPLAVDCPNDPRNPGRVVFKEMEEFAFYKDHEGMTPMAEACIYAYKGFAGDPHYFKEYPSSVWDQFELSSGPAECEVFHFITLRPPHGDGEVKHMHMRYGDKSTGFDGLLSMSTGNYDDTDACNPWWSVYCTAGHEGCDG